VAKCSRSPLHWAAAFSPIHFSNRVSDRAGVMRSLRNSANLSSWASSSSYVGQRLTWPGALKPVCFTTRATRQARRSLFLYAACLARMEIITKASAAPCLRHIPAGVAWLQSRDWTKTIPFHAAHARVEIIRKVIRFIRLCLARVRRPLQNSPHPRAHA
jgi:hypothetical protein